MEHNKGAAANRRYAGQFSERWISSRDSGDGFLSAAVAELGR
jgi:hypothetical protein